MLVLEVCQKLEAEKVPYVLVGGYAMAFQGLVRATVDVDLVISLKAAHLLKAENILKELGLTSRLPLRAADVAEFHQEYVAKRNLLAWSFVDFKQPSREVDLLIHLDVAKLDYERIKIRGQSLRVATKACLIELKTEAGRPMDLIDVKNLKEALKKAQK
ncbi:MAG: hypothetical protein ACK5P7_03645 [Bdellovibrio sp.]|jgi:hypothetical protein